MSRWIVFHVTERCSLDCRHCLRDPGKRPVDLPLAVVEKALDEAAALHGIRHAGFTGGDPLLWPHLEGGIDAVARRGFTWHLVSSGRGFARLLDLLDASPARREALTVVDLSVDGATPATHDAIRGEGSHREAMAAIAACSARGIPFALQMTVNARNQGEIEQAALAAAELGAKQASFAMTHATGSEADRELYLAPGDWDRVRDRVDRLSTLVHMPVTLAEGFRRDWRFHLCEPFRSEVLHVTAQGKLNLCCNHSGVPGGDEDVVADLATQSLADGHRRLLDLIHRMERERLETIAGAPEAKPGWDDFPCNRCLARLGKPHWVDGGSAGPRAERTVLNVVG
jgi:MoaA/NifB/PqqE/SkfB family radical SAM enzyme